MRLSSSFARAAKVTFNGPHPSMRDYGVNFRNGRPRSGAETMLNKFCTASYIHNEPKSTDTLDPIRVIERIPANDWPNSRREVPRDRRFDLKDDGKDTRAS